VGIGVVAEVVAPTQLSKVEGLHVGKLVAIEGVSAIDPQGSSFAGCADTYT
jgi:hypothetical protein